MDTIFGIPMTGAMFALLALLGVSLLSVAWVAWRRPVIFKLGVPQHPAAPRADDAHRDLGAVSG